MTQTQYTNSAVGVSQEGMILRRLRASRVKWVSMYDLSLTSGSLNVHSRISCLRKAGYQIPKPKMVREGRRIHSFYRIIE